MTVAAIPLSTTRTQNYQPPEVYYISGVFNCALCSVNGSQLVPMHQWGVITKQEYDKQRSDIHCVPTDNNVVSVSLSGSIHRSLQQNIERLRSFLNLAPNWNGYDACAFSADVIDSVIQTIKKLSLQPEIYPLSDGRVQLEYNRKNGMYLEFEINPDNSINVYRINSDSSETEYKDSIEKIPGIVTEFYG